jgi:hypothetical protein
MILKDSGKLIKLPWHPHSLPYALALCVFALAFACLPETCSLLAQDFDNFGKNPTPAQVTPKVPSIDFFDASSAPADFNLKSTPSATPTATPTLQAGATPDPGRKYIDPREPLKPVAPFEVALVIHLRDEDLYETAMNFEMVRASFGYRNDITFKAYLLEKPSDYHKKSIREHTKLGYEFEYSPEIARLMGNIVRPVLLFTDSATGYKYSTRVSADRYQVRGLVQKISLIGFEELGLEPID